MHTIFMIKYEFLLFIPFTFYKVNTKWPTNSVNEAEILILQLKVSQPSYSWFTSFTNVTVFVIVNRKILFI